MSTSVCHSKPKGVINGSTLNIALESTFDGTTTCIIYILHATFHNSSTGHHQPNCRVTNGDTGNNSSNILSLSASDIYQQ